MFSLSIELGNEAMRTNFDVASALERVALSIRGDGYANGTVRDENGNAVGTWAFKWDGTVKPD